MVGDDERAARRIVVAVKVLDILLGDLECS
jgi:hypothetical protein